MLLTSHSNVVLQSMESGSFPARRAVEKGTEPASTKHNTGLNQGKLQQHEEEPRLAA